LVMGEHRLPINTLLCFINCYLNKKLNPLCQWPVDRVAFFAGPNNKKIILILTK
jgi:hypothetical protein